MNRFAALVAALALTSTVPGSVSTVSAQASCAPEERVEGHRLLRQLSLDLLGRIPTVEEYAELDASGGVVDDAILATMLGDDDFYSQVRRYHQRLVWGSVTGLSSIAGAQRRISRNGDGIWRNGNARNTYRGRNDIDCDDVEQTEFDANGRPVPLRTPAMANCRFDGSCRIEGYVWVNPYWDPSTRIKVCAYDAQAVAEDTAGNSCTETYNPSAQCGCGPNLRQCVQGNSATDRAMRAALGDEPGRIFEHIIRADRSYLEAFTTRETVVNGASAHFYRHMSGVIRHNTGGGVSYEAEMGNLRTVYPNGFSSADWRVVERGPEHSGILTTFAYMTRLGSNRARANRFYTAFLCNPFVPSSEGIPAESDDTPDPNLRTRAGCADCHNVLEPAAAHFAHWRDNQTFGFMDQVTPLTPLAECSNCGVPGSPNCSAFCNAYFVTPNNSEDATVEAAAGRSLATVFLSDEEAEAVDTGPSGLIQGNETRIAECTARTLSEEFLGRELNEDELLEWLPELRDEFVASGYNFRDLVRRLVRSDIYRRTQ